MADGISSFWGPVTSTIECCEKNYAYSSYIAEFYNTISNIPSILLALIGLINALRQHFGQTFSLLHVSNMIIATGSMLYHATLQRLQQQSDETPMLSIPVPRMYKYYIHAQDAAAKRLPKMYVATIFVGSLCWLCDRAFCEEIYRWPFNPRGHALSHLFLGFNPYFSCTFLMFCRAQQRGWAPKVFCFMGILPYVKIEKPKSQ